MKNFVWEPTISTKLLLYSECLQTGSHIATFVVQVPKFVHTYLNSHRALSKNSASSRAIPARTIRRQVLRQPFVPIEFSQNRRGMRGGQKFSGFRLFIAKQMWLFARLLPCFCHYLGEHLNIHKEVLNRLIEPWMWSQVVLTATEWNNFILLRTSNEAQPEMQVIAKQIKDFLQKSEPVLLESGSWHLPFVRDGERATYTLAELKKVSAARCARVSYLLQNGTVSDPLSDIALCDRLASNGHWSPFEHVAMAQSVAHRSGNFVGWTQMRKEYNDESGGDYGHYEK